jgi:hypothetical protein
MNYGCVSRTTGELRSSYIELNLENIKITLRSKLKDEDYFRHLCKIGKNIYYRHHACPSFLSRETTRLPLDALHLNIFLKVVEKIQLLLKSDKNNG